MATENKSKSGRIRAVLIFCMLSLLLVITLPLVPYVIDAYATDADNVETSSIISVPNPAINLWNDVRQRHDQISGISQVKSVDSGVLINKAGEDWRRFRIEMLVPYGAIFMVAILGAIVVFHLFRGKQLMPGGRTGIRIPRMTLYQRTAHWFTAGLFWLLAITGLILLYGRFVLIPILGADGFSVTAAACKEVHNLFGPLFLLAVVTMFILYIKGNLYKLEDLKWMAKGGGMFGGHVSAGRYNFGEKTWFWLVIVFGLSLSLSGLVLDFAIFGQGREVMAVSHMVHGISALILISVSFGHIYLGTVGVEGTLDSMSTGTVDAAWAKAHHDQWYEEMTAAGELIDTDVSSDDADVTRVGGVVNADTRT